MADSVINIDNKNDATYNAGKNYAINGGNLDIVLNAGLFNSTVNGTSTASVGSAGGGIDVSIDSSIFSGFSGFKTYTLNITNPVPDNFVIKFNLAASSWVVVGAVLSIAYVTYDGKNTVVRASVTGGGVIFYATVAVNINIPGNPYGLSPNSSKTISLDNGVGQICYLEGTLIKTPDGDVNIERLTVGDSICICVDGVEQVETLTWVGKKQVCTESNEGRPVRIRKGALADGIPSADLCVTQEHCLYFDGRFVPARMLVNGSSIILDDQKVFTIYHLETPHHAVLWANGALSESYLDTGNRSTYDQIRGSVLTVNRRHEHPKSWETDAAAPLDVSRAFVEPLFHKLTARANHLGFRQTKPDNALTHDPDLHLFADGGVPLEFMRQRGDLWLFKLPAEVKRAWLTSRSGAPSDVIGPFVDDRRRLGVLVGQIHLFCDNDAQPINRHLQDDACFGWHVREDAGMRWTTGMAEINLEQCELYNPAILAIEMISAGPYKIPNMPVEQCHLA